MKNLWPSNLENEHKITPKEFLNEQALSLTKMTNGKLQGHVRTASAHPMLDDDTENDFTEEVFIHSLRISAPTLGYTLTLLRLAHLTIKIFPFKIYSNLTDKKYSGKTIEDLEDALKEIFNSPEVVEALKALNAQSSGREE